MKNRASYRLLHLVAAAAIGTFIYSPWRHDPTFDWVMSYGIFPFLAFTGFGMGLAPRLKRAIQRSRKLSSPPHLF